ncbi:hypothetical protein [Cellulomonas wangsupingiae]|uniref:Pyridoxamine 5'-phosphate oxidase putative domain-containing protein n=1 Tax=Cellulomonas wangsupingiae TaxID=2968085 RepID=A0ABY5K6G4_9CELL|nr:hypothetical protein [Cellulomonas wangsupingiae]MCC2335066.1 hypothetical protein [Cellulomonas wangsupingiae]MCM0638936.1 hypothetical protein [Cellulomonas wangsupingiae]UUI65565.1 hypothetical protein NP075_02135 [Cellulomonas wangsupingiae]
MSQDDARAFVDASTQDARRSGWIAVVFTPPTRSPGSSATRWSAGSTGCTSD